jgi:hypothetical protein
MDMRYRIWNVRRLCRTGHLKTVASELAKYKLYLVAAQEVRWDKGGSQPADDNIFFRKNGHANHHLRTDCFVY